MSARKARRPRPARRKAAPPLPLGAGLPLLVALVAVLHAEGRPVARWIADAMGQARGAAPLRRRGATR